MRVLLLLLILLPYVPVSAQSAENRPATACGSNDIKFDVKTSHPGNNAAPSPVKDKALVYFLQDDSAFQSRPRPSVRFAVDGSWVGATNGDSWFAVLVDPGVHHLCASWQSHVVLLASNNQMAALHFHAKAGKSYFFRMQDIWNHAAGLSINFTPIDSDEGRVLINKFSLSASHPKR